MKGKPRLLVPNRAQIQLVPMDLESLLPANHPARGVWEFVESLDLSPLYAKVQSVEGVAGRPAVDPRIYLALWLYATIEGVGSARALERLTRQHDAYRWILGGVSVNYHSLSDFRVQHAEYLDEVLTHSVAVLMDQGVVTLNRVSQDGIRVRANAGAASFRRQPSLERCLEEAEEQVRLLRKELEEHPEATSRRQAAARERAAQDRHRRVEAALAQLPDVAAKKPAAKKDKARVSTTDAEARVMKMGDGGFRPAYNGQFSVDTATQIVVGVGLNNIGNDQGQLVPMLEQIKQRYGKIPLQSLVDGGFAGLKDIETASELGALVYAPVAKPKDPTRDPYAPLESDASSVAEWRQRMGTPGAKEIYKQRAATVECVNAQARNRGLQRFLVRGQDKARAVLLWFAITHNLVRSLSLGAGFAAPA
jgi:transposase